jgi:hypothetical protein
MSREEAL